MWQGKFVQTCGVAALGLLLAASCNGLSDLTLTGACNLNSDCTPPLVCAFQVCHQQCTTSRDCPGSEICVLGGPTATEAGEGISFRVCELVQCGPSSPCPSGQVCAPDGICRDQCATSGQCLSGDAGQVCVESVCVDSVDLSDGGRIKGAALDAAGAGCVLSSDCGDAGLVCRNGTCQVECNATIDCVPPFGPGGLCVAHVCTSAGTGGTDAGRDAPDATTARDGATDGARDATMHDAGRDGTVVHDARTDAADGGSGLGKPCTLRSDCPPDLVCTVQGRCGYECNLTEDCGQGGFGFCCIAHVCYSSNACGPDAGSDARLPDAGGSPDSGCKACTSNDECQDGKWCDGEERCYANCCAPALTTPCDSNSPCVIDGCDEATETCSHTTVAGTDVDGDHHLAFGCAGGDDCDDNDPTVYTGHVEVFDGKDNDCNGYIDDFVAEPKGPLVQLSDPTGIGQGYAFLGAGPIGGPAGTDAGQWAVADFTLTVFDGGTQKPQAGRSFAGNGWVDAGTAPADDLSQWFAGDHVEDLFGTAVSPTSLAFLLVQGSSFGSALDLVVTRPDLSVLSVVTLTAGPPSWASVTWTGSYFFVGWDDPGANAKVALVDASGTLAASAVQQVATGLVGNTAVAVAANGTSLALLYTLSSGGVTLLPMSENGSPGTPITLDANGNDVAIGAAGVPEGFIAVWDVRVVNTFYAHGAFIPAPGGVVDAARIKSFIIDPFGLDLQPGPATFDGVGAAFLFGSSAASPTNSTFFGYMNGVQLDDAGAPANPFELSEVGPDVGSPLGIAGTAGRLAITFAAGNETHGGSFPMYAQQAGYCSLVGADCTASADCCSQVCVPVITAGPTAYSTCE